jgi:RNA 3'-terminal phosphate cyclase (ATP)
LKLAINRKINNVYLIVTVMFEIDGSQKSGSGTILRLAIALACITAQPLHIYNIRQNRPSSGLKPQHLAAVKTAAKICNAELEGAVLNSREVWFRPREIQGGNFKVEIGTAGSIPMLLMTALPVCAFSKNPFQLSVSGGTDVPHSPTINYLQHVLLPILRRMGFYVEITVHSRGYYPRGGGEVTMAAKPQSQLQAIELREFGKPKNIKGISVCTFLDDRKVAERQAKAAHEYLFDKGYTTSIQIINDKSNPLQRGSSITLWVETDAGVILGADAVGEIRKTSEEVGKAAAMKLHQELSASPTVDLHLADMLVPYIALAKGKSTFFTRVISDHLETNIWLFQEMLNTQFNIQRVNDLYRIEKGD